MSYIVQQRFGKDRVHVYLVDSHRVEGRTYPVQKRVYLGVLDQDASDLLLGRSCPEPTAELVALLLAKGISYSGRKVVHAGRKRLLREREIVLKTLTSCHDVELGRVSLLARLAGDSGLHGSLIRAFGEQDAQRILAAAIFECCEGGALCRLEDWADDTSLRDADLSLSPSSMTGLLQHLGEHSDLRNDFFRAWFKASGNPKALISDTTSISSYAEKLCLAEWGHNRDGEHLPQVNLNMVYSRETHLPLFYRLIHGSIADVTTLINTSQAISKLGLSAYTFSLDRGFFSAENLHYLHNEKLGFTIGVPVSNNREAQRLLDKNRLKFRSFKSIVTFDDTTLHHAADTYVVTKRGRKGEKDSWFAATAHLFLNKCERARQERELAELLHGIMTDFSRTSFSTLEDAQAWLTATASKSKADLFSVRKATRGPREEGDCAAISKDGDFQVCVAEKTYAATMKNLGMFMVLNSDREANAEETLRDNRSRDCQEKVFDILKNSTGNDRLRSAGDDSVEGRLFLAFIAVTLFKLLENALRKADLLGHVSVNKALDQARKLRAVAYPDGSRIVAEVPLKAREIFEVVAPGMLTALAVDPGSATATARRWQNNVVTSKR